jgi:hypothetical protein
MVPVSDLPAGVDPDELAAAPPTSARRSRLRRRVSFLRAAREVLLRDLGGFVYELHRTAGDIEHEAHRRLREVKLARLSRLDTELHELELRLDDVRRHVVVREPGVGGECPHCGELFASDAHFCAHCGLPLTESARRAVAREPAPEPVATAAEPQPAADQPTEEYSTLGHEFEWPDRAAADPHEEPTRVVSGEGESGATARTENTGDESAAGEAAGGEPQAAGGETAAGESAGAVSEAAGGEAEGGEPQAAAGDEAAGEAVAGEPRAARGDDAAAETVSGDDAAGEAVGGEPETARGDDAAGEAGGGEPEAARDDDAGREAAAGDETAGDEPRAAADDAGREGEGPRGARGEPDAGPGGAWHDSPGDAYSPLERRR